MKPIRDVYGEEGEEPFYGPCAYRPLVESIGHEILLEVEDDDCQGDSRYLLADGARRGYLCFGWGSCSGCDALQACTTYAEIEKLRADIAQGTQWFDDAASALAWFTTHDWEADHSWHADEQQAFIRKATEILRGQVP